jgi:LuxR family maltose regulon positive regulatory protein
MHELGRAIEELDGLKSWARMRGAGRLLLDLNIIAAFALRETGDHDASRREFDDAIGMAMFQNLVRPFVDNRRFAYACLEEAQAASSDRYRDQFIKNVAKAISAARSQSGSPNLLSDAEEQVLFYLSQGHSNKEIARQIGMSPDTVKYRLKSVFRKIGVHKRRDAARVSVERGLVSPTPAKMPQLASKI